jgi:four helix bundle protein
MPMTDAARDLMRVVHEARIRDTEFRDQATRAAKSVFLNLSEGLPRGTDAKRRKYFEDAQRSLFECVAAMDGAAVSGAVDQQHLREAVTLSHRVDAMVRRLMR